MFKKIFVILLLIDNVIGQSTEPAMAGTDKPEDCASSVEEFYRCLDGANHMDKGLKILTNDERIILQENIIQNCFKAVGCTGDPYSPVSEFQGRNKCFTNAKTGLRNILSNCVTSHDFLFTLPFETFTVEENSWYAEFVYERSSLPNVCPSKVDKLTLESCVKDQVKNFTEYERNSHFQHCDAQLMCPISPGCYKIWEGINESLMKCSRNLVDDDVQMHFLDQYKACLKQASIEYNENEPYAKYFTDVFKLNAINKQKCAKNFT